MTKQTQREEKRRQIIEALKDCLLRKSYHDTTIKDIAAEAHMPPGLIHYYFTSKEAILLAMADKATSEYLHNVSEWEQDLPEKTTAADFLSQHLPQLMAVMYSSKNIDYSLMLCQLWGLCNYNQQVEDKMRESFQLCEEKLWQIFRDHGVPEEHLAPLSRIIVILNEGFGFFTMAYDLDGQKCAEIMQYCGDIFSRAIPPSGVQ